MEGNNTEYRPIKRVLLNPPDHSFKSQAKLDSEWSELNYLAVPDFKGSINEYDLFSKLVGAGGEVDYLVGNIETTIDSIYARDASIATSHGMIIGKMGKEARTHEPQVQKEYFLANGIEVLGTIEGDGMVEGGDAAWVREDLLAIGRGYRTNQSGIEQVRDLVKDFAEIVEVHLPHFRGPEDVFHLMSVFSPVDKDLAVVYSPLMPVAFRELLIECGYRLVEVPEEEFDSQGCNVLAIAPRKCVMLEGNPITKNQLESEGVEVLEYKGEEISLKGCGGPTCLTRPVVRK